MEHAQSNGSFRLINGRLGSLSLPRDLTLGGTKNSKKVYKPNVNAVRNKDKVKDSIRPNFKKNERKPNHRTTRAKQNDKDSGRYVQSTSVFSEGGAEIKHASMRSDRYMGTREHEAAAAMEMPAIIKRDWNVDKKAEESIITELLADDEASSEDDDVQYMPVLLPLNANNNGFKKHFEVKKEPKIEIKKEPCDEEEMQNSIPKNEDSSSGSAICESFPLTTPIKQEPGGGCALFNGVKKYNDDDLNISLIKMPDSLPGKGFMEDTEEPTDFTLHQMLEGQIGKVLVRQSGKMEVIIGSTKYHFDVEEPPHFLEEVMVVPDEKSISREPTVVHLTSISDRFVISPSWEDLFLQGRIKKK